MLDRPLRLLLKLPVVDKIHPQSNKFVTGVKIKATGDPKLNDSPGVKAPCLGVSEPFTN